MLRRNLSTETKPSLSGSNYAHASEQIMLLFGGSLDSSHELPETADRDFDFVSDDELDIRIEEATVAFNPRRFVAWMACSVSARSGRRASGD